jgi:hypothetical protein
MFNAQDLQNLQVFLGRCDIKGSESMAMAEIQIKIANQLQALNNPEPPKPAGPPLDPPPADPPLKPVANKH